ncbi:Dihydrolipoyllysine-residue acetyltransferase component of pyruvate dehydrogenase complex [uncultured Oscillibacter sp.]|jgi:dihydrolipoyllysine-residue succinyltransferase component of 2-oxoglutarate dehydrogenase complex|nr:2-oxo acid dehydrogenase subunit E2 [Oscillibacter sp.]SCI31652.1 Dihydrolipoyllysine-residue acetyltransferase component of pyruvate dehydrogenase complex [uncultured Oscillibacter sp.]
MNERREKMTGMRKIIADNMRVSAQIPQALGALRIDMTALLSCSEKLKAEGRGVSMTSFLLAALGQVLRENPSLNSRFEGDEVIYYDEVNAGVAVANDAGLMIVVVKGIDRKDLFTIDTEFKGLMQRLRAKKLRMEDITGSTVTLSNLSKEKLQMFSSLITNQECLIVGMGGVGKEPVVIADDQIAVRSVANLMVNMNHIIIDGMPAARFLEMMQERLEHPAEFLVPSTL